MLFQKDPDQQKGDTIEDALELYSSRFGHQTQETLGMNRNAFSVCSPHQVDLSDHQVQIQFEKDLNLSEHILVYHGQDTDLDGEEVNLCTECALPLGDYSYCVDGVYVCNGMHAECAAQLLVNDMRNVDEDRLKNERQEKQARHEEYGVGWKADHIPRNAAPASKLAMHNVRHGMVCLVRDEDTHSVGIASTMEPALAVNLEYLSTSLQVRRREGHEPVFSLDPLSADIHAMQTKRFVPEWLAGTSTGEVLFQADYHLKELSMGEYDQPVVGMKSCSDHSDLFGEESWSAREWFLVRKAEIHLSSDNVLIPCVKMGVEAREQALRGDSLEDKQMTRPDHPMVKYAEAFTHNFDLIAERKSVIYHLRELAKASALAKHMSETDIYLEDSWYTLAEEKDAPCSLEVPQLWNERFLSNIALQDDQIVASPSDRTVGVYGGVEFGLDKFALGAALPQQHRAPYKPATAPMPGRLSTLAPTRKEGLARSAFARPTISAPLMATPMAKGIGKGATLSAAIPQFVAPAAALTAPAARSRAPRFATNFAALAQGAIGAELEEAAKEAPKARAVLVVPSGGDALRAPSRPPINLSIARPPTALSVLSPAGALGISALGPAGALATFPASRLATSFTSPALTMSAGSPAAGLAMTQPGLSNAFQSRLAHTMHRGTSVGLSGHPRLQGVDLRLDSFDLSSATRITSETQVGSWGCDVNSLDQCTQLGEAFWSCIDGAESRFQADDHVFLNRVFNPELSDRRIEGDCFVPPDASLSYVTKLRELVKDEDSVRQKRTELFLSRAFVMSEPGALFPSSWKSSFQIERSGMAPHIAEDRPEGVLVPRPEYVGEVSELLKKTLKASVPIFDKPTEEGLRFRIYRLGSLEVRTTQAFAGFEEIGAVFSVRPWRGGSESVRKATPEEKVVKSIQYVERAAGNQNGNWHYFLLVVTERGHKIVIEHLVDGTVAWAEDPEDLEDRISLAKIIASQTSKKEVLVQDLQRFRTTACKQPSCVNASLSDRKCFVRDAFACATGVAASSVITPVPSSKGTSKPQVQSLWWMEGLPQQKLTK